MADISLEDELEQTSDVASNIARICNNVARVSVRTELASQFVVGTIPVSRCRVYGFLVG